mmetsp:Transcript_1345/g.1731  ORF Transcript_1345/g.1731 Transcript_1345/m.1731 type:complete len:97 (-) Transcript_1345:12-302(-)
MKSPEIKVAREMTGTHHEVEIEIVIVIVAQTEVEKAAIGKNKIQTTVVAAIHEAEVVEAIGIAAIRIASMIEDDNNFLCLYNVSLFLTPFTLQNTS